MVASEKLQKTTRNSEARWEITVDLRVKRSLSQTSYTMFSIFYTKSISTKGYIYIIGGLCIISEMQIIWFKFEIFDCLSWDDFK